MNAFKEVGKEGGQQCSFAVCPFIILAVFIGCGGVESMLNVNRFLQKKEN